MRHCWNDGEVTEVTAWSPSAYPDALDQLRVTARDGLRDAVKVIIAETTDRERDDRPE
jgi:hypothetical protein